MQKIIFRYLDLMYLGFPSGQGFKLKFSANLLKRSNTDRLAHSKLPVKSIGHGAQIW